MAVLGTVDQAGVDIADTGKGEEADESGMVTNDKTSVYWTMGDSVALYSTETDEIVTKVTGKVGESMNDELVTAEMGEIEELHEVDLAIAAMEEGETVAGLL